LLQAGKNLTLSRVLVLGCSFKENIGDTRNSKVFDIVNELIDYAVKVDLVDPVANASAYNPTNNPILSVIPDSAKYDAIVLAVKHDAFKTLTLEKLTTHSNASELYLFDVKAFYDKAEAEKTCKFYWRL